MNTHTQTQPPETTSDKMKTLSVILPDGKTEKRRTKNDYKFVCAVWGTNSHDTTPVWGALSWHKTEYAAQRQLAGIWGKVYPCNRIIPVSA